MPTGIRRIGKPLSRVQTGLFKKPIRRKGEGPLAWYKRLKRWQKSRPPIPSKPVKPKKGKPKKKLTERQKRIKQRKEAEDLLGIKRGIKPKPKKPPKKKPPKKKKKK